MVPINVIKLTEEDVGCGLIKVSMEHRTYKRRHPLHLSKVVVRIGLQILTSADLFVVSHCH